MEKCRQSERGIDDSSVEQSTRHRSNEEPLPGGLSAPTRQEIQQTLIDSLSKAKAMESHCTGKHSLHVYFYCGKLIVYVIKSI